MPTNIITLNNWDAIYKNYQRGGEAWATLAEEVDPRFITLLEHTNFSLKQALDIGCGTGKYLAFLENKGFKVAGIDSSPTAVEMTKQLLPTNSNIQVADMYLFEYPKNSYDLIISVSTLHHGSKTQVRTAVAKIYTSLVPGGKMFVTLPNFDARKIGKTLKDHTELEPGTYAPNSGPEKGLPHSFFTQFEVEALFSQFNHLTLDLDTIGRWFITANK